MMNKRLIITIVALAFAMTAILAEERPDKAMLQRIYRYVSTVDTSNMSGLETYAYTRFYLKVNRKNPTLMLVPSVYVIAHRGEREFVGETYNKVTFSDYRNYETKTLLRVSTIPHRRKTFDVLLKYLTPEIYNETIIEDYILSPFHKVNQHFYRYRVSFLLNGTAKIQFKPKRDNTQLVTGEAIVDYYTGRVISCILTGEYDMVNFTLTLEMGDEGAKSLIPTKCELETHFHFIRNKVSGHFVAYYGLPKVLQDSITSENDYLQICCVRPDTLSSSEQALYNKAFASQQTEKPDKSQDTLKKQKRNFVKDVLWDVIGDNVVNRMKSNFGMNNQGYVRVNPILNPLYMGYDHRRGFTYKFDVRASYQLSDNSELSARLKAGYTFRLKQIYYRLPLFYYFNKKRNGYLKIEVGNGNHIRNRSVRDDIEEHLPDTTGMKIPDLNLLDEFRQTDVRVAINHDFSRKFSMQIGVLYQKKDAINKHAFEQLGWETKYRSFSPMLEIQYRPWGWNGPIFTADYDRSIKGIMKSNTAYERVEINTEYIHRLNQLQSFQMRVGAGLYTMRDSRAYFLNYENFKENNIPGGWNDDWSGEFELLRSETYNNSKYYIRANLTYESPLLLMSWLPWVGHYMEMERIYISTLDVTAIHPYVELGYGFTTRLFSMGAFVSTGQGNRVVGVKFGFELFRHW